MTRTAFQQIFEVAHFAERMSAKLGEKLSAKKVAKLYSDNVKQSRTSGDVGGQGSVPRSESKSERMIDDALTIARRGFQIPEVLSVLKDCDNRWGHSSPFDSVSKIAGLIQKAKSAQLPFVFESIHHLVLNGAMDASDFSHRFLLGDRGKGISYLEILLTKQKLLQHMLAKWLPGAGCAGDVLSVLHDKVISPSAWRANVAPVSGPMPNMSWKQVPRSET